MKNSNYIHNGVELLLNGDPVLVVGSSGAIGSRWSSIVRYLGFKVISADPQLPGNYDELSTHAIVATPTKTHREVVDKLLAAGYNVLCEKPLLTLDEDSLYLRPYLECGMLQVVNNWKYVTEEPLELGKHKIEYYNFCAGKESIRENLFQPIAFSSNLILNLDSPIWKCFIDDKEITREDFDNSYIRLFYNWIYKKEAGWGVDYFNALQKVKEFRL